MMGIAFSPFFLLSSIQIALAVWLFVVWRVDSSNRFVFTPFLVFCLVDMVFSWNYWLLLQEWDVEVPPWTVLISMASIFFFSLGYLYWSVYKNTVSGAPYPYERVERFLERRTESDAGVIAYATAAVTVLVIGIVTGVSYYQGFPPVAQGVAELISDNDLAEAQNIISSGRRELTKGHVFGKEYRGQGILKGLVFASWTYGLTFSLILALKRRRYFWKFMTVVFFGGALFFIAGTGERSRVLWCMVLALIGVSFAAPLSFRKLTVVGLFLTAMLIAVSLLIPRYSMGNSRWDLMANLAESVASRIISGDKINNVRVMNYIDTGEMQHEYGAEHLNVAMNALPGIHNPPLAHRIAEKLKGNTTTYASGTYLGTIYLDFGIFGVILFYFFMGGVVQECSQRLLTMSKRPEKLVFIAFAAYVLGNMSLRAGFITAFTNMVPFLAVHAAVMPILAYGRTIRGSDAGAKRLQPSTGKSGALS